MFGRGLSRTDFRTGRKPQTFDAIGLDADPRSADGDEHHCGGTGTVNQRPMSLVPASQSRLPTIGIDRNRLVRQPRFDVGGEVERLRVAIRWQQRQRLATDRGERRRDARIDFARRLNLSGNDSRDHLLRLAACDRLLIRQQFVKDPSQRIDVGSRIEFVDQSASLLRRHVRRCSHDLSHHGLTAGGTSIGRDLSAKRSCGLRSSDLRASSRRC